MSRPKGVLSIDPGAAEFLALLAKTLDTVSDGEAAYGSIYVAEVRIGFAGEDTGLRIYPSEHGTYEIAVVEPEIEAATTTKEKS